MLAQAERLQESSFLIPRDELDTESDSLLDLVDEFIGVVRESEDAGGKGDDRGYNPLVPGDDDLVVSVASTKLAGATDFRVLPVKHTFMMDDKTVQEYTLRFLQKGWFESDIDRQPL